MARMRMLLRGAGGARGAWPLGALGGTRGRKPAHVDVAHEQHAAGSSRRDRRIGRDQPARRRPAPTRSRGQRPHPTRLSNSSFSAKSERSTRRRLARPARRHVSGRVRSKQQRRRRAARGSECRAWRSIWHRARPHSADASLSSSTSPSTAACRAARERRRAAAAAAAAKGPPPCGDRIVAMCDGAVERRQRRVDGTPLPRAWQKTATCSTSQGHRGRGAARGRSGGTPRRRRQRLSARGRPRTPPTPPRQRCPCRGRPRFGSLG